VVFQQEDFKSVVENNFLDPGGPGVHGEEQKEPKRNE
jgi:hypothetical protein